MIQISYKDGQNWRSVDGLYVNWDNLSELFKEESIQKSYLAPVIYTDIWNGLTSDIQHIRHDVWYVEFWIKESEIQELAKLQSCSTIIISDLDNNLSHTVDMSTSELLQFNEPERIADTTNYKVSFIYQTNKTIINKYIALSNVVTIVGSGTYYSKYEKLPYIGEKIDTKILWDTGGEKLLYEVNKTGFTAVLYMDSDNMEAFKNDYNLVDVLTIDAIPVTEKLPLEIAELGEDNFKIIMSVITAYNENNYYNSLINDITLNFDSSTAIFYSKYDKIIINNSVDKIDVQWSDGSIKVLREEYKKTYKVFLYLNEADKLNLLLYWDQLPWVIDGTAVVEKLPLEITTDENGLFQIILSYTISQTVSTYDLGVSQTHDLNIDSGTHFYTDYPTIVSYEEAKNDYTNGDGIILRSKVISKKIVNVRLWLNEANKNSLVQLFNVSDDIKIDAVTVLENREVKVEFLGYDIYQCDVECLTATPTITYPQA